MTYPERNLLKTILKNNKQKWQESDQLFVIENKHNQVYLGVAKTHPKSRQIQGLIVQEIKFYAIKLQELYFDDYPVGYLQYTRNAFSPNTKIQLDRIKVDQTHSHKGLATQMINVLKQIAIKHGDTEIGGNIHALEYAAENPELVKNFYHKNGNVGQSDLLHIKVTPQEKQLLKQTNDCYNFGKKPLLQQYYIEPQPQQSKIC